MRMKLRPGAANDDAAGKGGLKSKWGMIKTKVKVDAHVSQMTQFSTNAFDADEMLADVRRCQPAERPHVPRAALFPIWLRRPYQLLLLMLPPLLLLLILLLLLPLMRRCLLQPRG